MTIKIGNHLKPIGRLNHGQVFEKDGKIYILTNKVDNRGNYTCVNLRTGIVKKYAEIIDVSPIKLECTKNGG